MIKNTALYNLANYESLHEQWENDVVSCKDLCLECCNLLYEFLNAEHKKNRNTNYHVSDMWDVEVDRVHRENWVTPVILLNNEMFRKSHNPNVKFAFFERWINKLKELTTQHSIIVKSTLHTLDMALLTKG